MSYHLPSFGTKSCIGHKSTKTTTRILFPHLSMINLDTLSFQRIRKEKENSSTQFNAIVKIWTLATFPI